MKWRNKERVILVSRFILKTEISLWSNKITVTKKNNWVGRRMRNCFKGILESETQDILEKCQRKLGGKIWMHQQAERLLQKEGR